MRDRAARAVRVAPTPTPPRKGEGGPTAGLAVADDMVALMGVAPTPTPPRRGERGPTAGLAVADDMVALMGVAPTSTPPGKGEGGPTAALVLADDMVALMGVAPTPRPSPQGGGGRWSRNHGGAVRLPSPLRGGAGGWGPPACVLRLCARRREGWRDAG